MAELDKTDALAASHLMASAVQASLVVALVRKGVLTEREARDVYEQALLALETNQAAAGDAQEVFAAARELIEQHLR